MLPAQFTNVAKVGHGGFGTVWSATAPGGVQVAVKMPMKRDPETLLRFAREVQLQSNLDHQNIVEILDFDTNTIPPWCAMPLAEGSFEGDVPLSGVLSLYRVGSVI